MGCGRLQLLSEHDSARIQAKSRVATTRKGRNLLVCFVEAMSGRLDHMSICVVAAL